MPLIANGLLCKLKEITYVNLMGFRSQINRTQA